MKYLKTFFIPGMLLLALTGCASAAPVKTAHVSADIAKAAGKAEMQTAGWGTWQDSNAALAADEYSASGWGTYQDLNPESSDVISTAGWGTNQPVPENSLSENETAGWGTFQICEF